MKITTGRHYLPVLLLPLFFLLYQHNRLFFLVSLHKILFPFWMMVGVSLLLYGLIWLVNRSVAKTGMIVFFIMLVLFYYGFLYFLIDKFLGSRLASHYTILFLLTCVGIVFFLFFVLKSERQLNKLNGYLSILMLLLVIVEVGVLVVNFYQYKKDKNLIYSNWVLSDNYRNVPLTDSAKPDIYFIVFDEYTNSSVLKEKWGFDNSGIDNWLKTQGFYVAGGGNSNYNTTPYSVAATLNMDYLPLQKCPAAINHKYILQSIRSLSKNQVMEILKKEGYSIHFKAPFENDLEKNDSIHFFEQHPFLSFYNSCLFYHIKTRMWRSMDMSFMIPKKIQAISFAYTDKLKQRYCEMCVNDTEMQLTQIKSTVDQNIRRAPKFVYGHLMITHNPHQFNADGNKKTITEMTDGYYKKRNFKETYTSQVAAANKTIRDMVSLIKEKGRKNTIIILQGDHGFRYLPDADRRYNFANFHAVCFPDSNYQFLYDSISPVNTFRVVFNHFFKQEYPLLKDSSVYLNY
jgi:hypothetical protein